jgi:hypothetical protein
MKPDSHSTAASDRPAPSAARGPALYIGIVLAAILVAAYYHLRTESIFGCQAGGYSKERYLVYCQTDGYGDFDHGAFWFNLEPEATQSAANAELLIVGNSRMQYGFSATTATEWLKSNTDSHFLLGFAYHPRVLFQRALMEKLKPRAKVYVINLDSFFEENASVPARTVMDDPEAQAHYRQKQFWQSLHHAFCGKLSALCGNSYAIYRTRRGGEWLASGAIVAHEAASVETKVDTAMVEREIDLGRRFLSELGVDPQCVIFTLVPTVDTPTPTSKAIAAALNVEFIAPELDDLLTFDGSHLDPASAERWSGAFFDAAAHKIKGCLQSKALAQVGS